MRNRRLSPEQAATLHAEQAPARQLSRLRAATGLWVRYANPVRPGYWLVRARLGPRDWGPLTPAAIMRVHTAEEPGEDNPMDRSPHWAAFVAGEPVSIWSLQQEPHTAGERIYRTEKVIDRAEYLYRLADLRWSQKHAADEATAQPHRHIDLMQTALPF